MPKEVSEITSGQQFSRSSTEGQLADSQTRVFKILKSTIAEIVDIQAACGVRIGDRHPVNANLYCVSFDARFDGDSRMVVAATFNYQSTPSQAASTGGGGSDPKSQAPDIRPANWSISSSLIEVPVYTWQPLNPSTGAPVGGPVVPLNAAKDRFDAIARYEPMVTISVQHFEVTNPTKHAERVGSVNKTEYKIASLTCKPHTLMLRGVSSQPVVESYKDFLFRGWSATYEFAYRRNNVKGLWNGFGNPVVEADIGWDIAVPETGFNVLAFVPAGALPEQDIFGQPLKHDAGKIVDPEQLPDGIAVGDKVRGMVKVFEYEDGGASQLPSAQPIPLNEDGTPRKSFGAGAADPPVIINRYRIYDEYEFRNFVLRGLGT